VKSTPDQGQRNHGPGQRTDQPLQCFRSLQDLQLSLDLSLVACYTLAVSVSDRGARSVSPPLAHAHARHAGRQSPERPQVHRTAHRGRQGARAQAALYDWILGSICYCYDVPLGRDGKLRCEPNYGRQVEAMARWVFSTYARAQTAWVQAKPESPWASRRFTNALPLRIRIDNGSRTRRLAFWLQPGRGPNYFQPADKQSITRRYRELCRRRGLRPRAGVLAGIRPQAPEVEVRDERGKRVAAVAELPEDPVLYVARLRASFDTAARAKYWSRCRILPPTPRVMIYRWVELAPPERRAERCSAPTAADQAACRAERPSRGRIDYHSECFPGFGRRARELNSRLAATLSDPWNAVVPGAGSPAFESHRGRRLSPTGQPLAAASRASRADMPGFFRSLAEPDSNAGRGAWAEALAALVRRGVEFGRRGWQAGGRIWNAVSAKTPSSSLKRGSRGGSGTQSTTTTAGRSERAGRRVHDKPGTSGASIP
jgi:hypothetical protein